MEVQRYIFQSPYSNQVQLGQPDPTSVSKKDEETSDVDAISNIQKEVKQNPLQAKSNDTFKEILGIGSKLDTYA